MKLALLTQAQLSAEAVLPKRAASSGFRVKLNDHAVLAMTDFTREYPITVDEEQQIDAALADMVRLGVRAMLVVRGQKVVGFISSYDIEGERPLQYLLSSNHTRHRDIQVGRIMTPWSDLVALNWRAVKDANVGDLFNVFSHSDAMHLLVLEMGADGATYVRGLFSKTRLERQLILQPAMSA